MAETYAAHAPKLIKLYESEMPRGTDAENLGRDYCACHPRSSFLRAEHQEKDMENLGRKH